MQVAVPANVAYGSAQERSASSAPSHGWTRSAARISTYQASTVRRRVPRSGAWDAAARQTCSGTTMEAVTGGVLPVQPVGRADGRQPPQAVRAAARPWGVCQHRRVGQN
ncbi:hypothetical protein [Actinomadura rubrisoli]|uniref:Uncharacterized protein n=1 Tax=Actinomadura rubrisoli TaxID=2530368 RepID=A0A4R5APP6_9ACTN|nr:hypothetical protein [Actinomadura rubrisoli]TDD73659.1 hypothetical protein E1298_33530 [Actinomadura rubrisoli]